MWDPDKLCVHIREIYHILFCVMDKKRELFKVIVLMHMLSINWEWTMAIVYCFVCVEHLDEAFSPCVNLGLIILGPPNAR